MATEIVAITLVVSLLWNTPRVLDQASVLTISCTTREARTYDLFIVFGFLRVGDNLPAGVPIEVQIQTNQSGWTTLYETVTKSDGGYYVEGNVSPELPSGEHYFRSVATNPYVISAQLPFKVSERYVPASNTHIMDYPTLDDEYKFSFATIVEPDGKVLRRPPFTNTNTWLFFAFAETLDKEHSLFLIGGFDAGYTWNPAGYAGGFRVVFDGGNEQSYSLPGPFYFTNHPPSPAPDLPTIHNKLDSKYVCFQSYDEEKHIYYVTIVEKDGFEIKMKITPRGNPFWLARKLDNLLWMHFGRNDPSKTEYWGAFVVMGDLAVTARTPQNPEGLAFVGSCAIDREWHGTVDNSPYVHPRTDLGQSYTAGPYLFNEEFSMATWKAYDPFRKQIFSQSGIIYVESLDKAFRFDNFTITDDAPNGLHPTKYFLQGEFGESGYVDLKAEVITFMYEGGDGKNEIFLRPIVLWDGTITLPSGTKVPVNNASGIGEEYRMQLLIGDVNVDDIVNMVDIALIAAAFGSSVGQPEYKPGFDLEYDGIIDIFDIVKVARNFGKTA